MCYASPSKMKTERFQEICVHCFIGGLIAVVIVKFHLYIEQATGWLQLFLYLGILFSAGVFIFLFEWIVVKLTSFVMKFFRVTLPTAKKVDGVWLHAIYYASSGEKFGGSVLRIRTKRPDEFHAEGKTFLEDGRYQGEWYAQGVKVGNNSFICWYSGSENTLKGAMKAGSGVCQYFYSNAQNGYATMVSGSFSAHYLTSLRLISGTRYGPEISENQESTVLQEYLRRQPQRINPPED